MKLSVIIVNYKVKYFVAQCLLSLRKALQGVEAEVFVVDNHSRDDSVNYLRPLFPEVNYISCPHNLGFSRANNIAIRQAQGEYILLLNPDTVVGETSVREVIDFMDQHPKAGGAGVRMMTPRGKDAMESRRALPSPKVAFLKMCGYSKRYYMSHLPWDQPGRIEIMSGAFCMLRHEAVRETGLLDEDFFMYGEDIDLSYRLLKKGWENWYVPARILHYKGESTRKTSFRYVHVFYDAMLIFFRKHYSHLSFWLSIPVKAAILLKAAIALVGVQAKKLRKSLGFPVRHKTRMPRFLLLGGDEAVTRCRRMLENFGMEVTTEITATDKETCMVFDTDAYSYDEIFHTAAEHQDDNISVGIYYPASNQLITPGEIIQ